MGPVSPWGEKRPHRQGQLPVKLPSYLEEAIFLCKKANIFLSVYVNQRAGPASLGKRALGFGERAGGSGRCLEGLGPSLPYSFPHGFSHSLPHDPSSMSPGSLVWANTCPAEFPRGGAQPCTLRAERCSLGSGRKPRVGASGQASWGRCPLRTRRTVSAGSCPFRTGPRGGTHTAPMGPTLSSPCPLLPSSAVGIQSPECGVSSPIPTAQKAGLRPQQAGRCRDAPPTHPRPCELRRSPQWLTVKGVKGPGFHQRGACCPGAL